MGLFTHNVHSLHRPARERGLGIIELMIGIVVGMIGCVAVFQMLSIAEERKRTVSAGADAQSGGTLALYQIERDLAQAGFGIGKAATTYSGCDVRGQDTERGAALAFNFVPIRIQQGVDGAPDAVELLIGSSSTVPSPVPFSDAGATKTTLGTRAGFMPGDLIVVGIDNTHTPNRCALLQLTGFDADGASILHVGGRFNPTTPLPLTIPTSGDMVNLGTRPRSVVWSIANARLTTFDRFAATAGTAVAAEDIVDFQAQYGYDDDALGTAGHGSIEPDEWVDTLPVGAEWPRVLAVRIAIVARSQQMERDVVTTDANAPYWSAADRAFVMAAGADTDTPAPLGREEWRFYRYRVFESSITLRNVIWGKP